jgi:hypothetical protein
MCTNILKLQEMTHMFSSHIKLCKDYLHVVGLSRNLSSSRILLWNHTKFFLKNWRGAACSLIHHRYHYLVSSSHMSHQNLYCSNLPEHKVIFWVLNLKNIHGISLPQVSTLCPFLLWTYNAQCSQLKRSQHFPQQQRGDPLLKLSFAMPT